MKNVICLILLFAFYLNIQSQSKKDLLIISAPAQKEFTKIDLNGKTVIPNGRFITPLGKTIITAPSTVRSRWNRDYGRAKRT